MKQFSKISARFTKAQKWSFFIGLALVPSCVFFMMCVFLLARYFNAVGEFENYSWLILLCCTLVCGIYLRRAQQKHIAWGMLFGFLFCAFISEMLLNYYGISD